MATAATTTTTATPAPAASPLIEKFNGMFEDAGHGGHKELLDELGGALEVLKKLKSNHSGLTTTQVEENMRTFGENRLPERRKRALYEFIMDALEDRVLQILIVAAIVSLVLELTIGDHPETGWLEGFAILVAVALVATVQSFNDFRKDRKFRQLESIKDDRKVKVMRNGAKLEVSTYDIVVGDVVFLSTGDWVPADMVLLEGSALEADESAMTGEVNAIKKNLEKPFVFSGTKIMQGEARLLVLAVGTRSQWGVLQMALRGKVIDDGAEKGWPHNRRWLVCPKYPEEEDEETPLQLKLAELADKIGYLGVAVALATFLALIIRFGVTLHNEGKTLAAEHAIVIVRYFLEAVTIIVVAVPEGLPLAVTIALSYSQRLMMRDNNLVRHLAACETMGGATNITTDKTGTLTENVMTVTEGYFGSTGHGTSKALDAALKGEARDLVMAHIAMNSTAFISRPEGKKVEMVGSKTECALLQFLEEAGLSYDKIRDDLKPSVVFMYPFSSAVKSMGVVLKEGGAAASVDGKKKKKSKGKGKEEEEKEPLSQNKGFIYYCKGASEVILARCSHTVAKNGDIVEMTPELLKAANAHIVKMASDGLRTLCLAYQRYDTARDWETDQPMSGLICQVIVGIKDPVRKEVPAAVKDCQTAGVIVRMVTGDNILTATHIAEECGIKTKDGVAMEGPDFRKLSNAELDPLLRGRKQLEVIARCSPLDKQRLVGRLQELGEVVASTGDGTNDAPQLKMADVGFAMGIAGTEVAKEACDIILMDDNFSSVVKALIWGRNVFDSIRKFLQFQLTINIAALVISFIGAIWVKSPLTAVQLLWVNLIMDTLASLALSTEPPTRDLLYRKPYGRYEALITPRMWRFILVFAAYQVAVLLSFIAFARTIWFFAEADAARQPLVRTSKERRNFAWCLKPGAECEDFVAPRQDETIIFNTFVLAQLVNEFNARMLGDELNMFRGVMKNKIFWGVIVCSAAFQAIIVEFGSYLTQTAHLSARMWLGCLVFAFISLPIGFLMRFLPVPEVCCIPMLAGGKPKTLEIVDDVLIVDETAAEHDGDMPRRKAAAVVVVADTPVVGKASHWDKVREVHTEVSVVNALRRSKRKKVPRN